MRTKLEKRFALLQGQRGEPDDAYEFPEDAELERILRPKTPPPKKEPEIPFYSPLPLTTTSPLYRGGRVNKKAKRRRSWSADSSDRDNGDTME
jgi:hypothetical protein